MKEIVILFFTFLGICKGFAQNATDKTVPDSLRNKLSIAQKPVTDAASGKEKATAKLYPNPAKNRAELEVKGFEQGQIQVQIIDVNGKKIRDDQRFLFTGNENITLMFSLQPGIYFVVIRQAKRLVKMKMAVQ
jgi:Secretion system C-terminal sorting domain